MKNPAALQRSNTKREKIGNMIHPLGEVEPDASLKKIVSQNFGSSEELDGAESVISENKKSQKNHQ